MIAPSNKTPKKKPSRKKPSEAFILVIAALAATVAVSGYFIATLPKTEDDDMALTLRRGGNIAEVMSAAAAPNLA